MTLQNFVLIMAICGHFWVHNGVTMCNKIYVLLNLKLFLSERFSFHDDAPLTSCWYILSPLEKV